MSQVKFILMVALSLSVCSISHADDWKSHHFNAEPNLCYQAAELAITKHHEIKLKAPNLKIVRFKIGTTTWSYGYTITISISPSDGGKTCTATTSVEKAGGPVVSWGSGKKEILKVYWWMEEELADLQKQKDGKG